MLASVWAAGPGDAGAPLVSAPGEGFRLVEASGGNWSAYTSNDDRFIVDFPGEPAVHQIGENDAFAKGATYKFKFADVTFGVLSIWMKTDFRLVKTDQQIFESLEAAWDTCTLKRQPLDTHEVLREYVALCPDGHNALARILVGSEQFYLIQAEGDGDFYRGDDARHFVESFHPTAE